MRSVSVKAIYFPDAKNAQIFAFRVADESGSVLGVLCLVFRFDDEMELIFSKLLAADDWTVVTILDAAGVVIASSDPIHIPVGAKLMRIFDAEYKIVKFGSLEYIATSRAAQPYQGYHGPDWCGHAMVPLQHAFDEEKIFRASKYRYRRYDRNHQRVGIVLGNPSQYPVKGETYSAGPQSIRMGTEAFQNPAWKKAMPRALPRPF